MEKVLTPEVDSMVQEYLEKMEWGGLRLNFEANDFHKGDTEHKKLLTRILNNGTFDKNPRPHYKDGTPAYSISINGYMMQFNLANNEFPIITLRPIAVKKAIGEILWIYQDQSNDLDLLKEKYGVTWWDEWEVDNTRTIGQVYGATVKRHDLMNNLLKDLKENPDGRRHIMSLWQDDDFKEPHGLKPCCFMTMWNVRHVGRENYLDMTLVQRSADTCTANAINLVQYCILLHMVARDCRYTPGIFSYYVQNAHIYDRQIYKAFELLERESVWCNPKIQINPEIKDFYEITQDDIQVVNYDLEKIKAKNPQIDFASDIAI